MFKIERKFFEIRWLFVDLCFYLYPDSWAFHPCTSFAVHGSSFKVVKN